MKKINKIIKSIFSIFTLVIFSSCQIGLGEAIDLQAPEIFLTSHKDNDYVGQTFRLAGYATDNEKVKSITIDFDEANIHYKWENSTWQKKTSYIDWTALTADECACTVNNTTVTWAVTVDTTEAKVGMQSSTYSYSIVAQDQIGNSGKTSKIEGSLVVDQNTPDIKLNSPALFSTNTDIQEKFSSFELRDGSVLSQLFNGTLVFEGRQDSAAAFKEFRLELDDGEEDSNIVDSYNFNKPINSVTTENISNAYPFGRKTLYYSKTLKVGQDGIQDLRTWTVSIKPEDWISSDLTALQSGKHKIRLVATSVSNSDAWQRKILGYFIWYPEADYPWITLYSGRDSVETAVASDQTYPSAKIFGVVQDDDGIESLSYSLEKQNADKSWSSIKSNETLPLTEKNAKNSQFNIEAPTESAIYKLSVNVKDIYGKTDSVVKFFKVLDVQPPKISLTSPTESTTVFSAGGTAIKFEGTISDDAKIKSIKIVHLNPAAANPLENKLKFINPAEEDWKKPSDSVGNLVFAVEDPKENYDSTTKIYSYEVNKSLDLFAYLKIGPDKPLITQDFVILAVDESDGATTLPISVIGDSESPKLTIDSITLKDGDSSQTYNVIDGIIKLPVVKSTTSATIKGTWSDNSTTHWNDISKINDIKFEWLDAKNFVDFKKTDDTWEVTVKQGSVPKSDGAITATLIDYANNIATISQTVTVEKAEIGLDRITCDSEDGSYNAGKELIINLEFTKSAKFITNDADKKPYLVLNNGAQAVYCGKEEDILSGTSRHQFKYTVNEADKNISKLDVSSIESNGCSWVDANTNVGFEIQQSEIGTLVSNNKTLKQRNIVIDTQAPFVNGITCISSEGSYKADKELIFKIEFNEDVTVTNEYNVELTFDSVEMEHVKTVKSGSKTLLSTYRVIDGNEAISIKGITANGSTVTDYAGNAGNYSYGKISFSNVKIDTTSPDSPVISGFTDGAVLIDDNASVSVNISGEGEQGATISYSIDNGATWNVYNSSITLSNNGVYKITAKQTDIAGNESLDSDVQTVTIDKGALIKKISATTFNGTYKADDVINGYIEFRGPVTLSNFNITLNVKNGDTYKTISISKSPTEGENNKYTFVYTVSDGDVLDGDYLNVSAISGNVTYKGQSKTISTLPVSNLEDNRKIKILTGKPEVVKGSPSITGEDENAKLNITFDRVVSKGSGNIELTISKDDFLIPTVLTESEYNDILVKIPTLEKYYKPGLNGATKNDDNTLTPDTTKKYILDFEINNDGSVPNTQSNAYSLKNLKELFISKDLNKVVIPMYSSAVSVTESSIIVDLTGEYKLPVKGAEYSITIPAGAVKDSVGNTNVEYAPEDKLLAPGVEKPEIRIQKKDYEISWKNNVVTTQNAKVEMPETASMKISCRTPNATIKYFANLKESDEVKVNDVVYHNTKTSDATVQEPINPYEQNTEVTIGSEISTVFWKTKFDNAKGLKIAIAAQSQKNSATSHSYEYAARTVLKFEISSGDGYDDEQGNAETEIIENWKKLKIEDLQIWVTGGDSPSGGNSIEPFPMSWGDFSKFKLMKYDSGKESDKVRGKWYWITWDLSAPAYHGFVAGDVPADAQEAGPTTYYAGECSWNPLKSYYILYPGETLRMQLASGHNHGGKAKYFFRQKNKGTRPLEPGETE
ncbi:MAG: hypothetical protein SPJ55_05680 [Treponema sp.]|nr:hypothetical protein [Treponema sp.]